MLYNVALLNSGFILEDPTLVSNPVQKLLKIGFGLRKDAPVEEIEVDISSPDEDTEEGETVEEEKPGEVEIEPTEDKKGEAKIEETKKEDVKKDDSKKEDL